MVTFAEKLCELSGLPSGAATLPEHLCAITAGGGAGAVQVIGTIKAQPQLVGAVTSPAPLVGVVSSPAPVTGTISAEPSLSGVVSGARGLFGVITCGVEPAP